MSFTLGSVIVKGGKVVSTGFNHQRPRYDEVFEASNAADKPVSMHAEMHAIFNATGGKAPPAKWQVQAKDASRYTPKRPPQDKEGPETCFTQVAEMSAHHEQQRRPPSIPETRDDLKAPRFRRTTGGN